MYLILDNGILRTNTLDRNYFHVTALWKLIDKNENAKVFVSLFISILNVYIHGRDKHRGVCQYIYPRSKNTF